MIEDEELGLKVAENPKEKFLFDLIEKIKKQIEDVKIDIELNQKFLEFDLKQKKEKLNFLEKEFSYKE